MIRRLLVVSAAFAITAGTMGGGSVVYAQGTQVSSDEQTAKYVELLRTDIKTKKVAIITEVLLLTDEQGSKFWPIYREYDLGLSTLGDTKISLIRSYADSYDAMTDEQAKVLAKQWFKLQEDHMKLLKKYFGRIEKDLDSTTAAKWLQIENQINLLIDMQIASNLPLIK